jgi:hypothetical protein
MDGKKRSGLAGLYVATRRGFFKGLRANATMCQAETLAISA